MAAPKSYIGVVKHFKAKSKEIRDYFEHVPSLVQSYPFDIGLSYMFARLEAAQHTVIYGGAVKIHRCSTTLASAAVDNWRITREDFLTKFKVVLGKDLPTNIQNLIKHAETVRDNILHGKNVNEPDKRQAISDILDYSEELNAIVRKEAGFAPFGDLRGFKGAASALDDSTSRWVLKGMGFPV